MHGCVSLHIVDLFTIGSFALQVALAQPNVGRVVYSPVSMLFGGVVADLCSSRCVWLSVVLSHRLANLL